MAYVIVADSGNGQRFWYAGGNKWSDERPDALEWRWPSAAQQRIKLERLRLPSHLTWSKAYVEND